MNATQLEFNMDNKTPAEMEMHYMKKQLLDMTESMGKVRRKLFAELTELRKLCDEIQKENLSLKTILIGKHKIEWDYNKPEYLFDISEKVLAFS